MEAKANGAGRIQNRLGAEQKEATVAVMASGPTTARQSSQLSRKIPPTSDERPEKRPGRDFSVVARHGDRGCLVTLRGELDAASAGELQATLYPWAEHCRRMTLDLREVTFLDSAGLRAILDLYRGLREREASLHLLEGECGNVPRVLRHAGLESLIDSTELSDAR
jgi:anti-anti-sigma factor